MFKDKIMVVGLMKNATYSFHKLFLDNELSSKHGGIYLEKRSLEDGNIKKYITRDCWVHDFLDSPNVERLLKYYPTSYYILPSRSFYKWVLSCIKQKAFINNTSVNQTGTYVLDLLHYRNLHYFKTDKAIKKSKTNKYTFINIDDDDIYKKIINIVPEDVYFKKSNTFPKANVSENDSKKIKCNSSKFLGFMKKVFELLEISEEDFHNDWIIKNKDDVMITKELVLEEIKNKLDQIVYEG